MKIKATIKCTKCENKISVIVKRSDLAFKPLEEITSKNVLKFGNSKFCSERTKKYEKAGWNVVAGYDYCNDCYTMLEGVVG